MSKFERVLSDAEIIDIVSGLAWSSADTLGFGKEVAEHIQQAVLARLHEQEPLAWYVNNDITFDQQTADSWKKNLFIVKPLYENPSPSIVRDKTACISENGESETQTSNQANLDSSSQEKIQIISLLKSLRLEFGAVGTRDIDVMEKNKRIDAAIEAIENHIPDASKMVKSIRDEFAVAALTGLLSNSGGPIQMSSQSGWSLVNCTLDDVWSFAYEMADAMLAAAPKYTGESK